MRRGIASLLRSAAAAFMALCIHPSSVAANSEEAIWWEQGLGHATVGYDADSGRFISHKFYLTAFGPDPQTTFVRHGRCAQSAVKQVRNALRADLLKRLKDPENASKISGMQILERAHEEFQRRTAACIGRRSHPFRLGFTKRVCVEGECDNAELALGGSEDEQVFSFLFETLSPVGVSVNDYAMIARSPEGVRVDLGSGEPIEITQWDPPLAEAEVQQAFENLVERVRATEESVLSKTILSTLGYSRHLVPRIVDVIADPKYAFENAPDIPAITLARISDELARTRIVECTRFQGYMDLAQITKCSGYSIEDNATLSACLSGGRCFPTMEEAGSYAAIQFVEKINWQELAEAAQLPRLKSGEIGQTIQAYNRCADQGGDEAAVMRCLIHSQVGDQEARILQCFEAEDTADGRFGCTANVLGSEKLKSISPCLSGTSVDAECLMQAYTPEAITKASNCLSQNETEEDVALCLAAEAGGDPAKAAGCVQEFGADASIELGFCVFGDSLPQEVRQLSACVLDSGSYSEMAVCAAPPHMPEDMRVTVRCAAESQGDVYATGLCVAAKDMKFEHRTILACAAATGGEPVTMGTCVFGKLTLKELHGCRTAEFGAKGCFGEGNEIQRLAKALTGDTISANSVVGQIVVTQIKMADATVAIAENAISVAGGAVTNFTEGLGHELEKISKDPVQALVDAPGNILREAANAPKQIGRAIAKVFGW